MRKRILVALALLAFTAAPIMTVYAAKPAYCKAAFVTCSIECGGGWFGEGCRTGCGIGYLMCG